MNEPYSQTGIDQAIFPAIEYNFLCCYRIIIREQNSIEIIEVRYAQCAIMYLHDLFGNFMKLQF